MKAYPHRFILLKKPENDFLGWYRSVQERYRILPYLRIENPGPFLMQTQGISADDGSEYIFIVNSYLHDSHETRMSLYRGSPGQQELFSLGSGNRHSHESNTGP
ncbi:MAG: hypothetical protein U5L72_01990 [Bacteroidales bacterium]|nr:hypothetical protein [Bacteroidales bacterium]